ncbi:MAG TPA: primosomal protein N' [Bacteroidaceae bacterium]|nr:primosomal protein N' [Bacteroidaceae bacterium]
MIQTYIDVILPLPLSQRFTYLWPIDGGSGPVIGGRVVVPFGTRKYYTGIVLHIHHDVPQDYEVKEVLSVLDETPIVTSEQLKLWQWISDYYMCALGDVYKAALPAGLKLESESMVCINTEIDVQIKLSAKEQRVVDYVADMVECKLSHIAKVVDKANPLPIVKRLIDKGSLMMKENIQRGYRPQKEVWVRLKPAFCDESSLNVLLSSLHKARKQEKLMMAFLENAEELENHTVAKQVLLQRADVSAPILRALVDRGVLDLYEIEVTLSTAHIEHSLVLHALSTPQQKAYEAIYHEWQTKNVVLLHGVTSSGKTEIFTHLIREAIDRGEQVLYLLPEIALTTQITQRLQRVFGEQLGVYHSKFSDQMRSAFWQRQMGDTPYPIVLGVRSSVFLPFRNLGLIIVDEEHESSYKQVDPAPRYHARNVAIMMASQMHAKVLLGTATPAVETYYNAQEGKYGLVHLNTRYQGIELPDVKIIDTKELRRKKIMKGFFAPELLEGMQEAIHNNQQAIVFKNRRGFSPQVECRVCSWVPRCVNCDVTMTYHKLSDRLTCHYCGYSMPRPKVCPQCGNSEIIPKGHGTERVEEILREALPNVRTARMDLDTTRNKNSYERILSDFESGEIDVLIGTQMLSKGLHFDRVHIVGIVQADTMLGYPDFRASERAFQLMAQVAGRAGRKGDQGVVLIQTNTPEDPIYQHVQAHDYVGLYNDVIGDRQLFRYPPFSRLIHVIMKHRDCRQLDILARSLGQYCRQIFDQRVLGPQAPPVGRVQNMYIQRIMLKCSMKDNVQWVHYNLLNIKAYAEQQTFGKGARIYFDVDPY